MCGWEVVVLCVQGSRCVRVRVRVRGWVGGCLSVVVSCACCLSFVSCGSVCVCVCVLCLCLCLCLCLVSGTVSGCVCARVRCLGMTKSMVRGLISFATRDSMLRGSETCLFQSTFRVYVFQELTGSVVVFFFFVFVCFRRCFVAVVFVAVLVVVLACLRASCLPAVLSDFQRWFAPGEMERVVHVLLSPS